MCVVEQNTGLHSHSRCLLKVAAVTEAATEVTEAATAVTGVVTAVTEATGATVVVVVEEDTRAEEGAAATTTETGEFEACVFSVVQCLCVVFVLLLL